MPRTTSNMMSVIVFARIESVGEAGENPQKGAIKLSRTSSQANAQTDHAPHDQGASRGSASHNPVQDSTHDQAKLGRAYNQDSIRVHGASEHNLQSVDLDIPRNALVVFTGVSGSGKSSLAFDTIYAEGQRRYVESLSSYARQFLGLMRKPEVRSIEGLSPAISIDQKSGSRNPRSTVGTITEIYDYLRLLYAHVGVPHSPATGLPITSQTPSQIVDALMEMSKSKSQRLLLLAPIARNNKGTFKKEVADLVKRGFRRFMINGTSYEAESVPELDKAKRHDIHVIVDRVVVETKDTKSDNDLRQRLVQSVEIALKLGNGLVETEHADTHERKIFSEKFACPVSGFTVADLKPRLFSFNAPFGSCATCSGLGIVTTFDINLVVPDPSKSIAQGAIVPWAGNALSGYYRSILESVLRHYGQKVETPFNKLPETLQKAVLYGTGDEKIKITFQSERSSYQTNKPFEGVMINLERRMHETTSDNVRRDFLRYQTSHPCGDCKGQRLNQEALSVLVTDKNIAQFCEMNVKHALDWIVNLPQRLSAKQVAMGERIINEIRDRLSFLQNVGLSYLTLNRSAGTLSGGESQRIRLASQIGSGLTGVLYVLDEPSIGLHQHDNARLLSTLIRLRDLGNSLIVVEHDEDTIMAADYLVDIGPEAGVKGGRIVAQGSVSDVANNPESLTGLYLSGARNIEMPAERRVTIDDWERYQERALDRKASKANTANKTATMQAKGDKDGKSSKAVKLLANAQTTPTEKAEKDIRFLSLEGARGHNLKGCDLHIPLGAFTCVTGVSGSGKSSLVVETLQPALLRALGGENVNNEEQEEVTQDASDTTLPFDRLNNVHMIDKIIVVNQGPIGRTPRSNPATYIGVMTFLREWFANLPEAKARGYDSGRFSFNVKGGRCETCRGDGAIKVEMHFLADVFVECDQCNGQRYNRETLEIHYRDRSIADILSMPIEGARDFFQAHPRIHRYLDVLCRVGLGYLRMGQSATTLSGGEAQRIKLAKELCQRGTSNTLYIFDEPTTGLHFEDVRKLIDILQELCDRQNTVLVIEHHLDMIKCADWVVDMGPEGGDNGGTVVAMGTPEDIAAHSTSITARYLRDVLAKAKKKKHLPAQPVSHTLTSVPHDNDTSALFESAEAESASLPHVKLSKARDTHESRENKQEKPLRKSSSLTGTAQPAKGYGDRQAKSALKESKTAKKSSSITQARSKRPARA